MNFLTEDIEAKLAAARPYNYFLTLVPLSSDTFEEPLCITFQDIFHPFFGKIECSVQMSYFLNVKWLIEQYKLARCLDKPMVLIYNKISATNTELLENHPQITAFARDIEGYGIHHTKIMLLGYKDKSMRVVILTANLFERDWICRTQGIWMSEKLEPLADDVDEAVGESATEFRSELLKYLTVLGYPELDPWQERIRKTDFRSVNVCLLTSVNGIHEKTENGFLHGHPRMAKLLSMHVPPIEHSIPIISESSSLGDFGKEPEMWLISNIVRSFQQHTGYTAEEKAAPIKIIYPSVKNVQATYDGLEGARSCLDFGESSHQTWLYELLHQWKADERFRSKALPHIKTYARCADKKLYWFLLTSANLSKGGWGKYGHSRYSDSTKLFLNNYEAGVLFLPKFITGTDYFSMDPLDTTTPVFPTTYDLPLTPYTSKDIPFLTNEKKKPMNKTPKQG